jgi:hypothetical protein
MKFLNLKIIFFLILFSSGLSAISQTFKKGCTKCEAIISFLNAPKVDSNFSHYNLGVIDTFLIVDMDGTLTECKISTWRGKPVKLLINGNLYDSVVRYWWPALKIEKRNLFKFSMNRYKQLFIQGYGSLFSEAHYEIKKGKYFVHPINNGVE